MKTRIQYKAVEWSYPTSPNAERFGFPSGCWTVEIIDGATLLPRAVAGFADRVSAIRNATKIGVPWYPLWLRFHAEDLTAT